MEDVDQIIYKAEFNRRQRQKLILFCFCWVVIWPVLVGAVLLVIAGSQFSSIDASSPRIGSALGVTFGSVVAFCLLFILLFRKRKQAFLRIGSKVLSIYTWIGVFLLIGLATLFIDEISQAVATEDENVSVVLAPIVPTLERNDSIDQTLRDIGAADEQVVRFSTKFVDGFSESIVENQQGLYQSYVSVSREFIYGEMSVLGGLTANEERTMIAHEYLHHIWYGVMDESTKESLSSHLITMYGKDPYMQYRVEGYSNTGTLKPTELFSYYCTESNDGYLTTYVLNVCNQYIRRDTLVMLR